MSSLNDAQLIPVERIYLDEKNPRHEPCDSQDEIINRLLAEEMVIQLARDIVKHELNPLELFAVIRLPGDGTTYKVAEGNRRLCALKLLHDPDLAPPKHRGEFEKLSAGAPQIDAIPAMIYDSRAEVDLWIARTHQGLQNGAGRKSWNADQKHRHSGGGQNELAMRVLDYAEQKQIISKADRQGKLTTAQRFLNNSLFRDALGLDPSAPDGISRTRSHDQFQIPLTRFVTDLASKKIDSRYAKSGIEDYARTLRTLDGLTEERVVPEPLDTDTDEVEPTTKPNQVRPKKPKNLHYSEEIHQAIQDLNNFKLDKLYDSLCRVALSTHTPLIAVGVWSFLESLTALNGRNSTTDFVAYLSKVKIAELLNSNPKENKPVRDALERLSKAGNATKHDQTAAMFNGEQMANDFEVIANLVLALAKSVKK